MKWLVIGVGGALGSLARHGVNIYVGHVLARSVPYATAAVNLGGSLAIGLLAGLVAHGTLPMPPEARTFVFVGVLGGFTTFSSFTLDTLTLVQSGQYTTALWNVGAQTGMGLLAVFAGYHAGVRAGA